MATLIPEKFEIAAPSRADVRLALESSRVLATSKFGKRSSVRLRFEGDSSTVPVAVPTSAVRLFLHLLAEMSQGNGIALISTHGELTTQQAADLLGVSRPYVVKLLDKGQIPSRNVGKYRRVRFDDLMAYKRRDDAARFKKLDELTAEAQKLGMGY